MDNEIQLKKLCQDCEVFSQIYTQENLNNMLSKKIFSFYRRVEGTKEQTEI